jgi:hypothetical protein
VRRACTLLASIALLAGGLVACGAPAHDAPVVAVPAQPGPAPAPPAPAPAHAELPPTADDLAKASALLERFHAAAASADEEAYFACFADGGIFLGTDATERWTVPQFRAYAHPRFASGKAWRFTSRRRDISARGDTAWFDEDLETANLGPARGSGVLVRDAKGEWKVAQYNLSIPIPNERFADVRRAIDGAPAASAAAPPPPPAAGTAKPAHADPKAAHADPPVCVAARAAAKRASPAAGPLAQQCRAAGGTP